MRFTTIFALFALVVSPALAMGGAEDIDARDLSYDEIDARDFTFDEFDARDLGYGTENAITARELASAIVDVIQERGLVEEGELDARLFGSLFKVAEKGIGMIAHHHHSHDDNNKKH